MGGDGAKTSGVKVNLQLQRCMSHSNKYQRALEWRIGSPFGVHNVGQICLHQGAERAAILALSNERAQQCRQVRAFTPFMLRALFGLMRDTVIIWKKVIADANASNGRSFLTRAYPTMKKNNPYTPIMIREAMGIEPRVYARYEYGREKMGGSERCAKMHANRTACRRT